MTITPKTLIYHCLIGLKVKVVQSSNPHYLIEGKIIDETKNTLLFKIDNKEKRIPKRNSVFKFHLLDDGAVEVNGKLLLGRPEERIKKKISNKWNNKNG